jgi:hypothetical protein
MKKLILASLMLYALPSLAKLEVYSKQLAKTKVFFVKDSATTPEQYSAVSYTSKADQAWVEQNAPLNLQTRSLITAEDLKTLTQEEMDQLYFRLSSGPIQPGDYQESFMAKGPLAQAIKNFVLQKFKGVQVFSKVLCGSKETLECITELAFKGKRIYSPETASGEYYSRNAVDRIPARALMAVMTPFLQQFNSDNWLGQTKSTFNGEAKFMISPAHIYCGQSMVDHRRESIVMDYAWGSDFKPFVAGLDDLFGRNYLDVRNELRMVRPGLYLGRAYAQKIFLLNFVLSNPNAQEAAWPADSCFNGKTTR